MHKSCGIIKLLFFPVKMIEKVIDESFCDECCYNDNPHPELRCRKIKCCYLVRKSCALKNEVI